MYSTVHKHFICMQGLFVVHAFAFYEQNNFVFTNLQRIHNFNMKLIIKYDFFFESYVATFSKCAKAFGELKGKH